MPYFVDLQPTNFVIPPTVADVPAFPTFNTQVSAQEKVVPSQFQELVSIKEKNENIQNTLQTFGNELVNIKK